MKIAVIGFSGAGKSTLAKKIASEAGILPLYLDRVNYLPDWRERDRDEAREIVRAELAKPDWVIDGNYMSLFWDERMQDADEILWLKYPRLICLCRVLKRNLQYRGQVRYSMANGCIEKLDWEFFWWVFQKGRTSARMKRFFGVLAQHPEKTHVFRDDRALDAYLAVRQTRQ